MTMQQSAPVAVIDQAIAPLEIAIAEAKKGDLVPVTGLSPAKQGDQLTPEAPNWMTQNHLDEARRMADALVADVKASPADVRLLTKAQALGKDSERTMVQPLALYEKKVKLVLVENQEGSKANQTLLEIKKNMDLVNPAVLRATPLGGFLGMFKKLPGADKVLAIIYENRETVMSTVDGLVENLRIDAENLEANVEDLAAIYSGLLTGQRLIERDIYVGQLVVVDLKQYLSTMQQGPERDNVAQFTADLSNQVIFLMDEENLNLQFFAGAQAVAKLTTAQLHNIRNLGRLLQRSVLASLGLSVAASELKVSMDMTRQLSQAIGNTVRDTAGRLDQMGTDMAAMRSEGGIDLAQLEAACTHMESFFTKMAESNNLVIERGGQTMRRLGDMSARLRSRVEGGHESMVSERAPAA